MRIRDSSSKKEEEKKTFTFDDKYDLVVEDTSKSKRKLLVLDYQFKQLTLPSCVHYNRCIIMIQSIYLL